MSKLKAPEGRILVRVDLESKNSHRFKDGTEIVLARGIDNFNRRETQPVNGIVVDGGGLPEGAQCVFSHNATHDTYRIFGYDSADDSKRIFNAGTATKVRYFSIMKEDCYFWKLPNESDWKPCYGFALCLKVYRPYTGVIHGIKPDRVKRVVYMLTGEHKGNVCSILNAADYISVFQGDNGIEQHICRLRHFEGEEKEREEIIAVNHAATELVNSGVYLVGLNQDNAKPLKEYLK